MTTTLLVASPPTEAEKTQQAGAPKPYAESTIESFLFPRGAPFQFLGAGYFNRQDMMLVCAGPVHVFSQILHNGMYYEIKTIELIYGPTPDNFLFRKCDMAEVPLYEAEPGTATWTKSRPKDARERMKDYIDGYTRATLFKSRGQQYDSRMSI